MKFCALSGYVSFIPELFEQVCQFSKLTMCHFFAKNAKMASTWPKCILKLSHALRSIFIRIPHVQIVDGACLEPERILGFFTEIFSLRPKTAHSDTLHFLAPFFSRFFRFSPERQRAQLSLHDH